MDRALSVVLAVVAGLIMVLGVAALVVTFSGDDDTDEAVFEPLGPSSFPPVEHDAVAARDLFEAWTRWRTATFVSSGTWTRVDDDMPDEPLIADVYTAQERPRRYQVRFGEVVRIDDEASYESRLVAELGLVGDWILGENRTHDVAAVGDGCFHAESLVAVLGASWGRWAEFCFDDATGAMVSARVRRQSAVDIERHDAIRAEVEDDDFGPAGG
ncbi:MAG: hypothetical protein AAF081_07285 [Actinomycetota bacterium]